MNDSAHIWHVYIIECRTSDLYVGISKNVKERLIEHNQGQACRYTKYRRPVKLRYWEPCGNYLQARKRERQIKKFSRVKKSILIKNFEASHPA